MKKSPANVTLQLLARESPQPYSSFGSRSEYCFSSAVISLSYASASVPCVYPRDEPKHMPHYPLPHDDVIKNVMYFQKPSCAQSIHFVSQVSCPKNIYSGSVTEISILGHTVPSQADSYPLYSENSSLEAPHSSLETYFC